MTCRHTDAQPADAPAGRFDPDAATSSNMLTSLTSQQFHGGSSTSFKDKPSQPAGLSDALRMMQLDDYEIKPSEIEIMTNLDGSPSTLGRGAFGEVSTAHQAILKYCKSAISCSSTGDAYSAG